MSTSSAPDRTMPASTRVSTSRSDVTFRELLDYTAEETARWERWLSDRPEVLDLSFADGRMATVRGVIQHIVAVERRYADRLLGDVPTPYDAIPTDSIEALFGAARDARARLERYIAGATPTDLAMELEFTTITAGRQRASARKIVAHALMHAVRTWAQLATVVRQQGHATDWPHDLLFSDALR